MQVIDNNITNENITNNNQSFPPLPTTNNNTNATKEKIKLTVKLRKDEERSSDKKIDNKTNIIDTKNLESENLIPPEKKENIIENEKEDIIVDEKEDIIENNNNIEISENNTNNVSIDLLTTTLKVEEICHKEVFDVLLQKQAIKVAILKEKLSVLTLTLTNTKEKNQPFFESKYNKLNTKYQGLNEKVTKQTTTFKERQKQLIELFKNHEYSPLDSQNKISITKILKIDMKELEEKEKEIREKQCGYDRIKQLNDVSWKALDWRLKECGDLLNQAGYSLGMKNVTFFGFYTDKNAYSSPIILQNEILQETELEKSLNALVEIIISLKEKVKIEIDACSGYVRPQNTHIDNIYKTYYEKYLEINNCHIEIKETIISALKELDKKYEDHGNDKIASNVSDLENELEKFSQVRKETDTVRQHLRSLSERIDLRMYDLHKSLNWLHIIIDNKYVVPLTTMFTTPIQPLPGKKIEEKEQK